MQQLIKYDHCETVRTLFGVKRNKINSGYFFQSETVLPTTIANGCISANRVSDPDTIVVEMQDDTRIAGVAK